MGESPSLGCDGGRFDGSKGGIGGRLDFLSSAKKYRDTDDNDRNTNDNRDPPNK
jgi:hypothetical protein